MPDRSLAAWNAQIAPTSTKTVTSSSAFLSALAAIQPGQLLDVVGPMTIDDSVRFNKALSGRAYVRFGADVKITQEVGAYGGQNYSVWGGEVTVANGYGFRMSDTVNFQWWGAKIHDCASTGYLIHGNVGPNTNTDIAMELWQNGLDLSFDPHAEKGTGVHGAYLGSSNLEARYPSSGRFALWVHDQDYGGAVQIGNALQDSELWVDARRINFVAQKQTGGNAIQLWGESNKNLTIHSVVGVDLAGRVVETGDLGSATSNIVVEYGRGTNVRLSPAYLPATGVSYLDCE